MIRRKTLLYGSVALAWWFMADDEEPTFKVPQCSDCWAATTLALRWSGGRPDK
jgi:hypothetical protein